MHSHEANSKQPRYIDYEGTQKLEAGIKSPYAELKRERLNSSMLHWEGKWEAHYL